MRSLSTAIPAERRFLRSDGLQRWYLLQAEHEGEARLVKQLAPTIATERTVRERWLEVAARNAELGSPACTRVLDWGMHDDAAYIVSHYPSGVPLRGLLNGLALSGTRLASELIAPIGIMILEALDHAYQRMPDYAHLDLDLDVISMRSDGSLVLSEFGLWSVLAPAEIARCRFDSGRVQYCAPEVVQSRDADTRSDIYSVGVLLYQLLTGEPAFVGATQLVVAMAIAEGRRASVRTRAPEAPEELCEILEVMLATSADERFQTPGAARNALRSTVRSSDDLAAKVAMTSAGASAAREAATSLVRLERGAQANGTQARPVPPPLVTHAQALAHAAGGGAGPGRSQRHPPPRPSDTPWSSGELPVNDGLTAHLQNAPAGMPKPLPPAEAFRPVPPSILAHGTWGKQPEGFRLPENAPPEPLLRLSTPVLASTPGSWSVPRRSTKWSEPSETVFQLKAGASRTTQACRQKATTASLLLISVAVGFVVVAAVYSIVRLFQ